MNEILLISRARGGDREAFGALVEQYRDNVYRLAYRMCGNAYDADEAGQNAANKAMRILGEVGMDVRVLKLNGAKDPDEFLVKYGPDRFRQALRRM